MEQTKFERAKQIEKEIENLREYKSTLDKNAETPTSEDRLILKVEARGNGEYSEKVYCGVYGSTPSFLKDEIQFQLESVCQQLLKRLNKRISNLEKEFNSL